MSEQEFEGPRVTDKRRVDPETGELRQPVTPAGAADPLLEEAVEAALVDVEVTEVEGKLAELTADLQRVNAEYANYRKRVERDRELIRQTAVGGVLAELLSVLDDIDRARQHDELEGAFKSVGESLEAHRHTIGARAVRRGGRAVRPQRARGPHPRGIGRGLRADVVAVYQPGYRFADRVLRPARVAVAGTD